MYAPASKQSLTFENPLLLCTCIYKVTLNAMFFDSLYAIVMDCTIKLLCHRRDRRPYQLPELVRQGSIYFFQKKKWKHNMSGRRVLSKLIIIFCLKRQVPCSFPLSLCWSFYEFTLIAIVSKTLTFPQNIDMYMATLHCRISTAAGVNDMHQIFLSKIAIHKRYHL